MRKSPIKTETLRATLLKRCRAGKSFTTFREIGKELDCSPQTVKAVVKSNVELDNWMKKHQRVVYMPTAQEIEERSAEVRAQWDDTTREARWGYKTNPVELRTFNSDYSCLGKIYRET